MNKIIPLLVCLSVVLLSCNNSQGDHHPNKMDTIPRVLFRIHYPNGTWSGPFLDTVIFQIVSKYTFKDSANSSGGHWTTDTSCFGRVLVDTLRDANKKPIYDTSHKPLMNYIYYTIPKGYVQKVTIPIN